ncbi:MAG: GDSL-type esterase/lipase family protein [Verrucomicrobiales bacterium]
MLQTSLKTIGLLATLAMGLTSSLSAVQAAEHFWDEIPLSPSTTMPAEVLDDYWNSEFQRVNREVAAAQNTRLVIFGDSITWSWSLGPATGRKIWENQFKDHHPINMGNSGDITPVMLHRATRGNLDFPAGQHPKVAVLLCGINNFGVTTSTGGKTEVDCYQFDADHEGHSGKDFAWFAENIPRLLEPNIPDITVLQPGPDDHAENITAVITALRARNPDVKIVITEPNHTANHSTRSPVVVVKIGMVPETKVPGADQARKNAAILAEAISPLLPLKKTSSSH